MSLLLSLQCQHFHCRTVLVWLQITAKHQENDTCLLIQKSCIFKAACLNLLNLLSVSEKKIGICGIPWSAWKWQHFLASWNSYLTQQSLLEVSLIIDWYTGFRWKLTREKIHTPNILHIWNLHACYPMGIRYFCCDTRSMYWRQMMNEIIIHNSSLKLEFDISWWTK